MRKKSNVWYRKYQANDGIETYSKDITKLSEKPDPGHRNCEHCEVFEACSESVFGRNAIALCEIKLYSNIEGVEVGE